MATTPIPSPERIAELFLAADVADVMAASDWYADARAIAETYAERYSVSVEQAAGVIAATSPLNSWGSNVALAGRILATRNFTSGYLGVGLRKAERILAGEDILTVLNGEKISNFYRSIVSAGEDGITVDRHAYDLAVGVRHNDESRPSIGKRVYAAVSAAYVAAGDVIESATGHRFSPAEIQSVTWVEWRKNFWRVGAWDAGAVV